jgi:hypothetical protein
VEVADAQPVAALWSVQPQPFEFQIAEWRRHTAGCTTAGGLGCISLVIVGLLTWSLVANVPSMQAIPPGNWWLFYGLTFTGVLLLLSVITYYFKARSSAKTAAIAATREAHIRYQDITVQVSGIGRAIDEAQYYVSVADREFTQHRYAPFWDAMEAAAKAIGQCHTCQGYLAFDIDQYVNVLAGRIHNFPGWDYAVTAVPEVEPALHRFARLKDAAEADYQFASMREFRETRQVMIAGFKTLGEALRHLENAVVTSIADLKRAVDRSVMLRAADSAHLQRIARFLLTERPRHERP